MITDALLLFSNSKVGLLDPFFILSIFFTLSNESMTITFLVPGLPRSALMIPFFREWLDPYLLEISLRMVCSHFMLLLSLKVATPLDEKEMLLNSAVLILGEIDSVTIL